MNDFSIINFIFWLQPDFLTANTKVATELKEIPLLTHNMQQTFLQIKNFGGERNNIFYVNFKLTSVGGRYFNPINFELSSKAGEAIFNNEKAFSVKQSAYFRADLKLGYRKY